LLVLSFGKALNGMPKVVNEIAGGSLTQRSQKVPFTMFPGRGNLANNYSMSN